MDLEGHGAITFGEFSLEAVRNPSILDCALANFDAVFAA
jgi:hypothetical protein